MELVGELAASHHLAFCHGAWRCMDTVRERSGAARSTDEAPPGLGADSLTHPNISPHISHTT